MDQRSDGGIEAWTLNCYSFAIDCKRYGDEYY